MALYYSLIVAKKLPHSVGMTYIKNNFVEKNYGIKYYHQLRITILRNIMPSPTYNPEQRAIARAVRLHPWLLRMSMVATQLCLVAAAQFSFRENQDGSSCTTRTIPFQGFGDLSTRQCEPIVDIVSTLIDTNNQTSELSIAQAYFEATAIVNHGGSDTQVQVPLECLQDRLFDIVPHVINTALHANPPLNPFPQNSAPQPCEITVDDMIMASGSGKSRSTISPSRHITFKIVPGLNANLCTMIIDYLNSQAKSCQKESRVRLLDTEKAFLVIALIIGSGAVIIAVGAGGMYCCNTVRNVDRNSFFSCWRKQPNTPETPVQSAIEFNAPNAQQEHIEGVPDSNPSIAVIDLEGQPQRVQPSM